MQIGTTVYTALDPQTARLTHVTGHDGRHQVTLDVGAEHHSYLFASAAELSELGHRFIELAAIAEEREHGPVDLDRVVA